MRTKTQEPIEVPLTLEENERAHIEDVLRVCAGNKLRAATVLGIDRSQLYRKLARWGLHERTVRHYVETAPSIQEPDAG